MGKYELSMLLAQPVGEFLEYMRKKQQIEIKSRFDIIQKFGRHQ